MPRIPFNKPHAVGTEHRYLQEAIDSGWTAGNGGFTRRCHTWLEQMVGCHRAFLTHSATGALEMAALLLDLEPGDEVIMPSFTFVSTANAFVLRGAVPVFVDIRPDTLCLDEARVAAAMTSRTKAICAVHYAGNSCDLDAVSALGVPLIEDAAQGLLATWRGRQLGSIGAMAAVSFHETKNVISGEGGALLVNDPAFSRRAEIIWQKGTNRAAMSRGEIDKYTWIDIGSSFLPSELTAAFLFAQMEKARELTAERLRLWSVYNDALATAALRGMLELPPRLPDNLHNGHMFPVLFASRAKRTEVIAALAARDIHAVFHYVPLHSSPAGRRYGRAYGSMAVTESVSERLLRLPLWIGLPEPAQRAVAETVSEVVSR